jgi:hypothetical protein
MELILRLMADVATHQEDAYLSRGTCGCPILPSKGDLIEYKNQRYKVSDILWNLNPLDPTNGLVIVYAINRESGY